MINEDNIKNQVLAMINKLKDETDSNKATETLSNELTSIIVNAIKSATVTVEAGILVNGFTSSGSAVTGATSKPGTGKLS